MSSFLLRRLAWGGLVLLIVATLTFFLMHVVPGGPFDKEKKLPPEIKANVEAKYHLDQPVWRQYVLYLGGLAQGDLGPSYKYLGRTVNEIIGESFPVSIHLGGLALIIAIVLGIGAGIAAALRPHGWPDRLGLVLTTVGISVPSFVLGTFFVLVFAHQVRLFPPALWEGWRHTVLPAVTLGVFPAAYIARLTRSSILDVIHKDFVRTARAKGVTPAAVLTRHVLKNAMTPVLTYLGPLTAFLVTGSFIVEFIFSIPGLGKFFITAVTNRDYPLMMGVTLVYAAVIVLANLVVDLCYTVLDPRVRLE